MRNVECSRYTSWEEFSAYKSTIELGLSRLGSLAWRSCCLLYCRGGGVNSSKVALVKLVFFSSERGRLSCRVVMQDPAL